MTTQQNYSLMMVTNNNNNSVYETYEMYDEILNLLEFSQPHDGGAGKKFFAFVTPFIIAIGLIGNTISLRVFTSTRLRKLSASFYLAALSASDSIVLLTYVLFDWLLRGLPHWPHNHRVDIIHKQGLCQGFLFVSYMFRFTSVYLIVIFTIERYVAVCRPLQRKIICTKGFARKLILAVHITASVVSLYKPILSGLYSPSDIKQRDLNDINNATDHSNDTSSFNFDHFTGKLAEKRVCTWNTDYESFHFVMELVYGLSITAVPFILVTVFNMLMIKKLISRYMQGGSVRAVFQKNNMRIEFTITVIAVSTSFVCLNIPYFVVWLMQNLQSFNPDSHQVVLKNSEALRITRTIFSLNYSMNFFVYCLTGSYYRGVIESMAGKKPRKALRSLLTAQDLSTHAGSSATDAMITNITELKMVT